MHWSKKIANGLGHIAALAECELSNHELTEMACRCDACTGKIEDEDNEGAYDTSTSCQCDDKPFDQQCEGCRTTEEWALALAWIGSVRNQRSKAKA
jgi:hypothetical protein